MRKFFRFKMLHKVMKGIAIGGSVVCLIGVLAGCNKELEKKNISAEKFSEKNLDNDKKSEEVEDVLNDIHTGTEIKISELFLTDEPRIWYVIRDGKISYDVNVAAVFACKDGKITYYDMGNWNYPELEEFDGMEYEEVINYVETTLEESPHEESIKFLYDRDDSGNDIETEILSFSNWYVKYFHIGWILEPKTVLSNRYFGITTDDSGMSFITKYDFTTDTKVILNEIDDPCMVDYEKKEEGENKEEITKSEEPEEEFDAGGYMKALLDNSYKGDSSAFVEKGIGTSEEAEKIYEDGIEKEMTVALSGLQVSEELETEFCNVLKSIYKSVKYKIGEVSRKDSKTYEVEVVYEKMEIFEPAMETFNAGIEAYEGDTSDEAAYTEQIVILLKDALQAALNHPVYGEEESVIVRVELANDVWSPNESDVTILQQCLFDTEKAK